MTAGNKRGTPERLISPRTLQIAGLVLLFAAFGFWAYSGRESALLVGAALSLIGLGSYEQAARQLRERIGGGEAGDRR